jgi:SAM-dependent methyltransferase
VSGAFFRALARDAAARYPARDRYARRFAYGKLTGDPVFEHILSRGLIPAEARILDIGCGQGLLAALLACANARQAAGDWPADWPAGPRGWRLRGIDFAARDIERARQALGAEAEFTLGDMRVAEFGDADVVVILDVLHYIDPAAQADVLRRVSEALARGGSLLARVADASGGLRFRITEAIDLAVTRMRGNRVDRLHSVPLAQRKEQLENLGFRVQAAPMSTGTPFANVLLVARYDSGTP